MALTLLVNSKYFRRNILPMSSKKFISMVKMTHYTLILIGGQHYLKRLCDLIFKEWQNFTKRATKY